jgi:aminocarboxymuconate-semialdehyde decarboxylase
MARMVFSGFYDRWPKLQIVTHHMGGMVPYFEGRVGYGWDVLGSRTTDEGYEELLKSMKKRPIDYFRLFLADTALFGARAATVCASSSSGWTTLCSHPTRLLNPRRVFTSARPSR